MPYDPYKVNDIMSQTTGLMLGAGNLGLRRREVDLEEKTHPIRNAYTQALTERLNQEKPLLEEQKNAQRFNTIADTFKKFNDSGITPDQALPILQPIFPNELGSVKPEQLSFKGQNNFVYKDDAGNSVTYFRSPTGWDKITSKADGAISFNEYNKMSPREKNQYSRFKSVGKSSDTETPIKVALQAAQAMANRGEINQEEVQQKALELSAGYSFLPSPEGTIGINKRNPGDKINTGIKKILPKEAGDELSMITTLTDIGKEIKDNYKPEFSGIEGLIRGKSSKYINDPNFVKLNNLVESMRMEVYAYSGKAINETEQKWLQQIQGHLNQPDENFIANLDGDLRKLELIKKNRENQYKKMGYGWDEKSLSNTKDSPTTAEEFLKMLGNK
jgi:hypothetical protein